MKWTATTIVIPPISPLRHLHHHHHRPHTATMASKHAIARPLSAIVRASKASSVSRSALRTFATTTTRSKELAADVSDLPNLRHAQRGPQGKLAHAPVINNADKTADRATAQHQYGQYLLSCLPKYIQQYAPARPLYFGHTRSRTSQVLCLEG